MWQALIFHSCWCLPHKDHSQQAQQPAKSSSSKGGKLHAKGCLALLLTPRYSIAVLFSGFATGSDIIPICCRYLNHLWICWVIRAMSKRCLPFSLDTWKPSLALGSTQSWQPYYLLHKSEQNTKMWHTLPPKYTEAQQVCFFLTTTRGRKQQIPFTFQDVTILCVNLTGPLDAKIFGQTLFQVCL